MGAKYTEGQARASAKYMADKHQVRLIVPEADFERYKAEAERQGLSINQFVINCIEKEM